MIGSVASSVTDMALRSGVAPPIASGAAWRDVSVPLECGGRRYSGKELDRLVNGRAGLFRRCGIVRGERVLVVMENSADVVITILGLWRLGAVVVPVPPRDAVRGRGGDWLELVRRADLTGAVRVIASSDAGVPESLEHVRVASLADPWADTARQDDGVVGEVRTDALDSLECTVKADDVAVVQFSSGSTGEPKAIVLTHGNMHANASAVGDRLGLGPHTVGYCWLPLHHDMGLMGGLVTVLLAAGRFILSSPRDFALDPVGWLVACAESGVTFTGGPPFAYQLVLDRLARSTARLEKLSLATLNAAIIGSERVTPSLYKAFEETLAPYGWRAGALTPAYGLAENTVAAAMTVPLSGRNAARLNAARTRIERTSAHDETAVVVGCGVPVPGTTVSVRDDTGNLEAPGTIGRIWIRGDSVAKTEDAGSTDGWQSTGDVGALIDGELYVVGRTRELIKSAGRTFAPQDLEDALRPMLPDAYAVGVAAELADERATDALYVVVEQRMRPDEDGTEITRVVNSVLTGQFGLRAQTTSVVQPGTLPRTSSGKIRRAEIPVVIRALGPSAGHR